jgi:hypothetical protein
MEDIVFIVRGVEIQTSKSIFEDFEESPLTKLVNEKSKIELKRDPVIFKHFIWYLENELKIPCYPMTLTGEPHLGTLSKLQNFRKELEYWQLDVPI